MRAVAVASRDEAGRGARAPYLLLVALLAACGADAGGVAQGSGALEPEPQALEPARSEPARAAGPAQEQTPAAGADEPAGPATAPLVLPSGPSITEPPAAPSPLPSAELNTGRPVGSSEPADVVVPPGNCRFEYLGEWVRCENAGWPNVVETDAPDLLRCAQQCLERDDCTAVTDYFWLGLPELGCFLYLSTCEQPALATSWGEEDGGRDFRRVCDR